MKNMLLLIGLIVVVAVARYAIGNYEFSQAGSVTEIFIIRGVGSLFMDFRLKVLLTMATVALMVMDWRRNKRPDYFWVGVGG
jgi:flagellar motor component MotA